MGKLEKKNEIFKIFLIFFFSCVCPTQTRSISCRSPLKWNNTICNCSCPITSCPSGYTFDDKNCKCVCNPEEAKKNCTSAQQFNASKCGCFCVSQRSCLKNFGWNATICDCSCKMNEKSCDKPWVLNSTSCSCDCGISASSCPKGRDNLKCECLK